jgi:hypothetical protein
MALCSQIDVEHRLQWDITDPDDVVVAALITSAQALIEAEVGRTLESDDREETFDGGRIMYFLNYWPVTEITTLIEDGETLTETDDFLFYPNGKLVRMSNGQQVTWTRKRQAIEVEYVGGYLSPIHDAELEHLKSVCAEIVARAFRRGSDIAVIPPGSAGAVQSVSATGSDTVSYATGGNALVATLQRFVTLDEAEREQLKPYKRRWLGFA